MTPIRHRRSLALLLALSSALVDAAAFAQQSSPGAREGLADLPGVRLWFTDGGGTGAPVVFVHAATGSSRVWEYQRPVFTARGFRVIAYDRRGYGRSAADPSGPQPGTGADDLNALMDYLKIDRFHLVGTAAGGIVAWDYALSFPTRLRSLVVANSFGGVQDPDYQQAIQRLRTPDFLAMSPDMRELGPAYRVSNPEGAERWRELERTARPASAQPPAQTFRNRVTFALLETIAVPTLLLTGDADMYAPPPIMRMFAARVKDAQAVVIPETGHSAYWEQPEIFNRTVIEFVSKH
jgi:pimeloyl-ACP methyl ester carboxylesterase